MLKIIILIIGILLGGIMGIFIATLGALTLIKKKGYNEFDQIPDGNLIKSQDLTRRTELMNFKEWYEPIIKDFGFWINKADIKITYSDNKTKKFSLFDLADDVISRPNKKAEKCDLIQAVALEIMTRKQTIK